MKKLYQSLLAGLFLCVFITSTFAADLFPFPKFTAIDSNGDPLSGGLLNTYEVGSTTRKDTFKTDAGTTANANPVVLDTLGQADVWLAGCYRMVLTDSDILTQWTVDNVCSQTVGTISSAVDEQIAVYSGTTTITGASPFVISSGKMGVGTASPTSKLHVENDSDVSGTTAFSVHDNTGHADFVVKGDGKIEVLNRVTITIGATASDYALRVDSDSAGIANYAIFATSKWGMLIDQDISDGIGLTVTRNSDDAESAPLVFFENDHTSDTFATLALQNDGSGPHITTFETNEDLEIDPAGTGNITVTGYVLTDLGFQVGRPYDTTQSGATVFVQGQTLTGGTIFAVATSGSTVPFLVEASGSVVHSGNTVYFDAAKTMGRFTSGISLYFFTSNTSVDLGDMKN